MVNQKAVEYIKDLYPWAKVARMDLEQGKKEIWLFSDEPTLFEEASGDCCWSWSDQRPAKRTTELGHFDFFAPLLAAENADPKIWELRLD